MLGKMSKTVNFYDFFYFDLHNTESGSAFGGLFVGRGFFVR